MTDMNLVEIFWSVQGEGTEVGVPSVFVRFGECDLRCAWCDSPETWLAAARCRIEQVPGSGVFAEQPNPVSVELAVREVERLQLGRPGLVSITGGEPLLQPAAVSALAIALRARGSRLLLETHGLAVDAVGELAARVDVVSMDWKLSSDVRRESDSRHGPVASFHDRHEAFLSRALEGAEARVGGDWKLAVKVVVTPSTRDDELRELSERIARVRADTPLILQPVTPSGSVREAPSGHRMLACLQLCRERLGDVRVIPQTHKSVGLL